MDNAEWASLLMRDLESVQKIRQALLNVEQIAVHSSEDTKEVVWRELKDCVAEHLRVSRESYDIRRQETQLSL